MHAVRAAGRGASPGSRVAARRQRCGPSLHQAAGAPEAAAVRSAEPLWLGPESGTLPLRRAGQRAIRIHDARHTFASIRLAAGIDPATVSKRLGHSNVAVTHAICTHAIESAEEDTNDEEKLARYRGKRVGGRLVVESAAAAEPHTEVILPFLIDG
jgi:hypothetical protein